MRCTRSLKWLYAALPAVIVALLTASPVNVAYAAYGFTPYEPLNTNAATDKGQDFGPVVAADSAGTSIAVWQSNGKASSTIGADGDLFFAISLNHGKTWSNPETLNTNATTDSLQDAEPAIATDGNGHWIVVWASQEKVDGSTDLDWDLLYAVFNGATWSDPATLNTNASTDSNTDQSPSIVSDKHGHWVVVWGTFDSLGGTIGNDGDILVSRSSDNGTTWTSPAALNTNAASDSAMDSFPSVESNTTGTWITVWQVYDMSGAGYGSDADVLYSRSADNGSTWSAPVPLNDNASSDESDEFAVTIASNSSETLMACWTSYVYTDEWEVNIAYSVSTNYGVVWSNPSFLTTDGMNKTSNERCSLACDGAGTWMAVWEGFRGLSNTLGADGDIVISLSTDDGASWAPPRAMKQNAPKDDGVDADPKIVSDGVGNWIAVWESKDTLNDTIGKDWDILMSTTVYPQPLQIQKPNGGETYVRGVKKSMTWTTSLDPNDSVQIELWRDGAFVHRVDKSTENDGLYKLTIPSDAEQGNGYIVRVILKSYPGVFDESDAPFKVK
ncbi:MAG: exo-alpha-sialidase [Candidatus Hydrogenedentes bacterium]|nr:exo-alpha-sialidase [Candidatus Hydrogenedentota bacterium]